VRAVSGGMEAHRSRVNLLNCVERFALSLRDDRLLRPAVLIDNEITDREISCQISSRRDPVRDLAPTTSSMGSNRMANCVTVDGAP